MKLWKCDPYVLDNKGFVTVVVMAETRQQAIEKASAKLSAKLPEMLGRWARCSQMTTTGDLPSWGRTTSTTPWRRRPMRW